MYRVEEEHNMPYIRKGDLESRTELEQVKMFKTKKAAISFIESKLRGLKSITRNPSVKMSYYGGLTGKTWINENSGEKCYESFYYILKKDNGIS